MTEAGRDDARPDSRLPAAAKHPRPAAAHDLASALAAMTYSAEDEHYTLVAVPGPPDPRDLVALAPPAQLIVEREEVTLLVRSSQLAGLRERHGDLRCETDLVWVRFDCPMGWEVVGFLAHVTTRLAAGGIPVGAVASYARDHLFIAQRYWERAAAILSEMFPAARDD